MTSFVRHVKLSIVPVVTQVQYEVLVCNLIIFYIWTVSLVVASDS